ncbi:MAG: non-heme iron oxygenase ferredoxin subunit [Planctomycetes bacterium]|nr:non-heme iron oxygenase ferredoxin subunit [Planctomycetota bacterium]
MAEFEKVLKKADLPEGKGHCVKVAGKLIAIWHAKGQLFAIDDACTHADASLAEGWLTDDCTVACPWHGAEFDLKTGAAKSMPAVEPIKSYPVRVTGDDIEVQVE